MARAETITGLPLDRWAQIMGLNPLHFNQLASSTLLPGTVCGEVMFQHAWQNSDRVGREDIALAIQSAEQEIEAEVGYNLLPRWTTEERLAYPQPVIPGVYGAGGFNVRGQYKSVELMRGHIISGGVRAQTLIQAGAAIVRTDDDVDTFDETCTVVVPTTVTDVNEICVYYPAKDGDSIWEIRPVKVTISGGFATIKFKVWQVVAANQMDAINAEALDAHDNSNYETEVDVYRVHNDPSTQVQFMWESSQDAECCGSCVACQFGTQAGCFHLRDPRIGFAVPVPASWDVSSESFTWQEFSACREPDQVRFWYYSGYQDLKLARPKVQMAPYWEKAVAFYAASKLDRPVCGCTNVQQFIEHWVRDGAYSSLQEGGFSLTPEQASNHLGTSQGALYAWKEIQRNGVKVSK